MEKSNSRLISLDIFRGIIILFMLIVCAPGSRQFIYPVLSRSVWNGCKPADLIFPVFLFITGVSAWYSMKKYNHEISWKSAFRVFRRVIALFILGLFLNLLPDFKFDLHNLEIMGVLQKIALAYGIGVIVCLIIKRENLWIFVAAVLLAYWGLLFFFGGDAPFSPDKNFIMTMDRMILGVNHIQNFNAVQPEANNLTSTISGLCLVVIGYFIGGITGNSSSGGKTVLVLFLIGISLAGLGLLWNLILPFNGYLWTGSFILYTGGIAILIFGLIFLISDVFKMQKWGFPFLVTGTNALFTWVLAEIWIKTILIIIRINSGSVKITLYDWLFQNVFAPVAGNLNGSLLFAVIQMLIIWSISLILYRKKILIRL